MISKTSSIISKSTVFTFSQAGSSIRRAWLRGPRTPRDRLASTHGRRGSLAGSGRQQHTFEALANADRSQISAARARADGRKNAISVRCPQTIADPDLRQDVARPFGIAFDLAAELAHIDAQVL